MEDSEEADEREFIHPRKRRQQRGPAPVKEEENESEDLAPFTQEQDPAFWYGKPREKFVCPVALGKMSKTRYRKLPGSSGFTQAANARAIKKHKDRAEVSGKLEELATIKLERAEAENVSLRSEKSNLRTELQRSHEREKRSNKKNAQLADSIELLRTALDNERAARNCAEAQLQMSAHAIEKRQWLRNASRSLENESGNAEQSTHAEQLTAADTGGAPTSDAGVNEGDDVPMEDVQSNVGTDNPDVLTGSGTASDVTAFRMRAALMKGQRKSIARTKRRLNKKK